MRAKLIVTGGKANKREVEIELPATIGRSREASLTVGHRMISRKHCEAYLVDGLMMIRDVGSLNGTYVHGRRIREAPLPPGEKFTIGPITFRVDYEYSGDRSKLPPLVPAEPAAADSTLEPPPATAELAEPTTEPVKETKEEKDEDVYAVADEDEGAESKTPPASAGVEEEPDFEVLGENEGAESKTPPASAGVEEEPDFEVLGEDDFELAIEEPQEEDSQPEPAGAEEPPTEDSKRKSPEPEKKEKAEAEIDPEDQLLDDFLNDVQ